MGPINYILIEIAICIIISFILVFYYSRRGTNPLALITAGFTWCLNFILIVFIPFDIYYTYSKDEENEDVHKFLYIGYYIIYWTMFICSWIFVPLMQEYENSGDFTKKQKFIRSIKNNIIFYGILGIIGIIFLVIGLRFYGSDIEGLMSLLYNLMNCSYLIGLLLYYFLFGYSIINVPKRTFLKINYEKQIRFLEWRVIDLKNNLAKIQKELVDDGYLLQSTLENFRIMKRVNKSKSFEEDESDENKDKEIERTLSFSSKDLTDYSEVIKERYDYLYDNAKVFGINLKINTLDNEKEPLNNVEELIKLNRKININEWDDLRIQIKIRNQYKHWLTLSTVLLEIKKNNNIEENLIPSEGDEINENEHINENEEGFIPYKNMSKFLIFYYKTIKRPLLIIYFILLVLAGILTLISQIGVLFDFSLYGSIIKFVIEKNLGIYGLHIFIMIPIIFLFVMSIYTFFRLKISGYFNMYKNRQTDSVSLMYFTTNLCRISFSICLDFIFNINKAFTQKKENKIHFTQMELIIRFNKEDKISYFLQIYQYSPLILLIYVLILIFKIPQRLAKLCGKKIFEVESDEIISEIKEGHDYFMEINKEYEGNLIPEENLKLPEDKYNK